MLDNFVEAVAEFAVLLLKVMIAVCVAIGLYVAYDSSKNRTITKE